MHLLKRAMVVPGLAREPALLLVDYHIERNKTAKKSHAKTWTARRKNVKLLPL